MSEFTPGTEVVFETEPGVERIGKIVETSPCPTHGLRVVVAYRGGRYLRNVSEVAA
jgi:hypothetical protein